MSWLKCAQCLCECQILRKQQLHICGRAWISRNSAFMSRKEALVATASCHTPVKHKLICYSSVTLFKVSLWYFLKIVTGLERLLSSSEPLLLFQRNWISSPGTHTAWLTTTYNSSFRRPDVVLWPLWAPTLMWSHTHAQTCVHTDTCTHTGTCR